MTARRAAQIPRRSGWTPFELLGLARDEPVRTGAGAMLERSQVARLDRRWRLRTRDCHSVPFRGPR